MSDDDMIGKLVRWECRGQWFTARVTGYDGGSGRGSLTGEVVDPGNYIGFRAAWEGADRWLTCSRWR